MILTEIQLNWKYTKFNYQFLVNLGCLIYNEDRTEIWETSDKKEIKIIKDFVENKTKSYVAGTHDKKTGKIIMMHLLPDKNLF